MKLKTVKFERVETPTEIELPVYLYEQDEFCNDTYIKIDATSRTTISNTISGLEITVDCRHKFEPTISEHELGKMTKKEYYDEHLIEALKYLTKSDNS